MQTIVAERDALKLRVHELELRTSSAEAVARQCRAHMAQAEDERDQLARRIAGLDQEKEA
jgi:cell division protein FtsB